MNPHSLLINDGFLLLPNVLTPKQIEYARSCMSNKNVKYNSMTYFIDEMMMKVIDQNLGWNKSTHLKYRASDNNNSSDAGSIHRDIFVRHMVNEKEADQIASIPVYTCLCYLDRTVMELVPGSHRQAQMSFGQAWDRYWGNRQRVTISPGDLLIMHSTLLHRGIFTERLPHRRLIQVFEVFPSEEIKNWYLPNILHVPSNSSLKTSEFALYIHKNVVLTGIVSFFSFFLAATGHDPDYRNTNDNAAVVAATQHQFYSSEGTQPRLIPNPKNTWQPGNHYILRENLPSVSSEEEQTKIRQEKYVYPIVKWLFFLFLGILLICSIFFFVNKIYCQKQEKKRIGRRSSRSEYSKIGLQPFVVEEERISFYPRFNDFEPT